MEERVQMAQGPEMNILWFLRSSHYEGNSHPQNKKIHGVCSNSMSQTLNVFLFSHILKLVTDEYSLSVSHTLG